MHSAKDVPSELPEGLSIVGVPERARWPLSEVGRFLPGCDRLLEAVRWRDQADTFMGVEEDTFCNLEDAEAYLVGLGLAPQEGRFLRFVRTSVSYYAHVATASFDDGFYTYARCYLGGTVLIKEVADLADELVAAVTRD